MRTSILAAFCCLLWASAFVFIKIGLPYSAPLQFAGQRFLLSGLMVLLWWFLSRDRERGNSPQYSARGDIHSFPKRLTGKRYILQKAIHDHWGKLVLLAALQIGVKYALFYQGLALVPASVGALIGGSGPLMAVMITAILPPYERLSQRALWALLLGMVGVAALTLGRESMGVVGSLGLIGIGLLIGNTVVSAVGDWVVAHYAREIPPPLISSSSLILGGVMLLGAGIGIEGYIAPAVEWAYWGSLFALCAISGGAITIWFTLLRRPGVQVGSLSMWKFLIPLLGAIIAWGVMPDETPTLWAIIGMLLVSLAVWLLPRGAKRMERS